MGAAPLVEPRPVSPTGDPENPILMFDNPLDRVPNGSPTPRNASPMFMSVFILAFVFSLPPSLRPNHDDAVACVFETQASTLD